MSSKKKNKKINFLPRLIVGIFMAIAVAQTVATIGAFNAPEIASAQVETTSFTPQVPIQGTEDIRFGDSTRPIAEYVKAVYAYAVGAVGILATVMLMIGGLRWILAAGNPSSVSEAKDMIVASLSGMVLVLTSYLVLNQVNPALTDLSKNISKIQSIEKKEEDKNVNTSACEWVKTEINQYCKDVKGDGWINKDVCSIESKPDSLGQSCCCPPIPEGCPDDQKINCKACDSCQALTIPCKNSTSCQLNSALASKLSKVYQQQKGWRVTEAWPPKYPHASSCHTNGLCADINLDNGSTDKDSVKALAEKLTAAGLTSFQYECTSGPGCCSGYDSTTKCTYNDEGNGNHFHVNN